MKHNLKGKTVVITGASKGIGKWLAEGFAEVGSNVVVTSESLADCELIVKEIKISGGSAIASHLDVTKKETVHETLQKAISEFDKVDILINNAGSVGREKAFNINEQFFDNMFDVNVKGAFFCSQVFGEHMKVRNKGKIINLTSAAGKLIRKGIPNTVYSMTKGAVNMMTKALAEEWSSYNINVNAIGPGYFNSEIIEERLKNNPHMLNTVIDFTPLGRIGEKEDIIGIAQFLASDLANFVTGQIWYVDGGRTIL